jgi:putative nucleotidyltransferase with HDIG domain
MKKLVITTWIGTSICSLLIAFFTLLVLKQSFSDDYLLFVIILTGFLPFIMTYHYLTVFIQRIFFLVTTSVILAGIFYLAPYIGHVIFYLVPIYAVLFKEKIYFIFSFVISVICYTGILFLQPEDAFIPEILFIQLFVFLCYILILYSVATITVRQEKLNSMYTKTMEALVLAIEAKDDYTRGHSTRVSEYSMILGTTLEGNGHPIDLEVLRISSLLHDIGKVNISIDILQKKGKLTKEEYEEIKKHPSFGAEIAISLEFPDEITKPILFHHERKDGKGYPKGLEGENIPLLARVIAIADTFDALTTTRSYRDAFSIDRAKEIILENSGTQFDENLIPYFIECFPRLKKRAEQLIEIEKQLSIAMEEEYHREVASTVE